MDFIEGLPRSANHDTILVIVDKFSKYSIFLALKHPFTALDVAKAYMLHVFKTHGLPQAIASDRDRIFTSALWQELFRLSKTELRLSSSYHPQSDGQTERVNQCLEAYLRCSVHACPGNWFHWLHLAEYWYNTSIHTAHGMTPFQVMFGRLPREFGTIQANQSNIPDLAAWLHEREVIRDLLRQQLLRAQQRMKQQADKHRSEREFAVGDSVYLKLQPYVQTSIARRPHQKLAFRYYGPYTILQRVGQVAYKLNLPASSQIHAVVHVSLLKKAVGPDVLVSPQLPPSINVLQTVRAPAEILAHRLVRRGKTTQPQVLVRWQELPAHLATWEAAHDLHHLYKFSTAWGHAETQEGGNVTTTSPDGRHKRTRARDLRRRRQTGRRDQAQEAEKEPVKENASI
jgi:ribosomal protein L21E